MSNSLSPRVRAAIINYDPTRPEALSVTAFFQSVKISRSVFYKIRARARRESAAALHPQSRAPKHPARHYGPDVINKLVQIRQQLKTAGWDYGPRTIHYEAALLDVFPGGRIPSVATIARLLFSVGQVDPSPKKRPKSSYIPFARSTAMALWQLDAFEYTLTTGQIVTIYQLLDDATRFDVGTYAYERHENSTDAKHLLQRAISKHGAPQELLSDNSLAFNQLRRGSIGSVEIFLASHGTIPISGVPGKPTTQGKNERSHQTLGRFLNANRPDSLKKLRARIAVFREHYNGRRPHQALRQATPQSAWELLAHTPATEPIPLVVLEAKAAEYLAARRLNEQDLARARAVITARSSNSALQGAVSGVARRDDQMLVEVTRENRQTYFQGFHISLPTTFAGRVFWRSITDDEFVLADPATGEIVFSFPLPMVALRVKGKHVLSYSIQGVWLLHPTKQWAAKHAQYVQEYELREAEVPAVFGLPEP